jgi:ABC-type uncharacterized transport system permease subunit
VARPLAALAAASASHGACVSFGANQVTGVSLNLLALGGTTYLSRALCAAPMSSVHLRDPPDPRPPDSHAAQPVPRQTPPDLSPSSVIATVVRGDAVFGGRAAATSG